MHWTPKVIPLSLFPGDWCIMCNNPGHNERVCGMLEFYSQPDGISVEACPCDISVTMGIPGEYLVRVTEVQKE